MAEGPLVLLDGYDGQAFIETGLVVYRHTRNRLFEKRSDRADRGFWNNIILHHEWVHYVQSITCASVHFAAQKMLHLSAAVVKSAAQGNVSDSLHQELRKTTASLYARRANESVQILDRPGFTIINPIPDSHQIGMLDLMEGVAVLESFKLCTENASVEDFLWFRNRYYPGTATNVYRWSFNWLAHEIGLEAAYELLGPVSFFALQTHDPAAEFVSIVKKLSKEKNLDHRELADVNVLTGLVYPRDWASWLQAFEHGEPESGHVTLDPCATFAVSQLGVKAATQLGATPSQVTSETFQAFRPPVIAYSGMDAVTFEVAAYAKNKSLDGLIVDWTSVVGAAERLTIRAETDVYQFCPHRSECPHFESALCHRNFAPPGVTRSYDQCRFPDALRQFGGLEPSDLWVAVGRERKSVREVVEAFEATGEAGLWELARRQRASIIRWLGMDGYNDLKWKCKMVADKTLHALKTQKMQDFIEARMFRDAVVDEVRRLARERIEEAASGGEAS